ncbi:MAG: DUF434 domain-containing protein [Bacteroidetes bacterium]|nr:DUF434 domain-containing protein [Bacteroidota bacterium]
MLTHNFKNAKQDYRYLLEKNYPQKGIIKLIGDRYALSGSERTMLYRGITTRENCLTRKKKLALVKELKKASLYIDGYNVMITIGSYLNGNTVYISNDHLLRDASGMHGKVFRKVLMKRILELLLDDLIYLQLSNTIIYFDRPVSKSAELASFISRQMEVSGIPGHAETAESPDYILKQCTAGFIASSDSNIIDKCHIKTFDLARHVISRNFHPVSIDLREER